MLELHAGVELLEEHTDLEAVGDKAFINGHYYSEKAPARTERLQPNSRSSATRKTAKLYQTP